MRRTGTSPLFVRCDREHWGWLDRLDFEDKVISILTENWTRVRSLKIKFGRLQATDYENDRAIWCLLERPATTLEVFELMLCCPAREGHYRNPPVLSASGFKVFDHYAPSLKVFITPYIRPDIRASWTSQLRVLELYTPIPVYELLEALKNMPFLESLRDTSGCAIINGEGDRLRSLSSNKIRLPRLQSISICTGLNIMPYLIFLQHIEPSHGRVLAFYSYPGEPAYDPDEEVITAASDVLRTFSKHAGLARSTELDLHLMRDRFEFQARLPGDTTFRFFQYCYGDLPAHTACELFGALNFEDFPQARKLALSLQEIEGVHYSDSKIARFLKSVATIAFLETSPDSLRFLLLLPDSTIEEAFPDLQHISIRYLEVGAVSPLHPFLVFRRAMGRPISILSISILSGKFDLTFLEEFTGLKVIMFSYCEEEEEEHEIGEYICGSGSPQELILDK